MPMFLNRTTSAILFALAGISVGCKQAPPSATAQQVAAHAVPTWTPGQPTAPQREAPASNTSQAGQQARVVAEQPKLEDVEERKGPLTIGGQTFTIVLHSKRLPGQKDNLEQALASLEIFDASGVVQHREEFPYAVENGTFAESCGASVNPISGSNGAGFLLVTGCEPSAPGSGGPWRILAVTNGQDQQDW